MTIDGVWESPRLLVILASFGDQKHPSLLCILKNMQVHRLQAATGLQ